MGKNSCISFSPGLFLSSSRSSRFAFFGIVSWRHENKKIDRSINVYVTWLMFWVALLHIFFFRNRIVNWASRISLRSVYSGTVEGPPTHLFYVLSTLGRLTATIRPVQSTSQRTLINESRTVCRCHWTVKQLAIAHFHLQLWTQYGNISDINKEYRQRQNRLRFLFFFVRHKHQNQEKQAIAHVVWLVRLCSYNGWEPIRIKNRSIYCNTTNWGAPTKSLPCPDFNSIFEICQNPL